MLIQPAFVAASPKKKVDAVRFLGRKRRLMEYPRMGKMAPVHRSSLQAEPTPFPRFSRGQDRGTSLMFPEVLPG